MFLAIHICENTMQTKIVLFLNLIRKSKDEKPQWSLTIFPLSFTMLLLSLLTTSLNIGTMGAALGTFLVAQTVKNLSAMQDTRVQSLGREDPLEKGMATHSSSLPWRIP